MILIFINFTTKSRTTTYATFWIFVTSYPTSYFLSDFLYHFQLIIRQKNEFAFGLQSVIKLGSGAETSLIFILLLVLLSFTLTFLDV